MRPLSLPPNVGPASPDGLLAIRGVVESVEPAHDEADNAALHAAASAGLTRALEALAAMRLEEGAALHAVLTARLESIDHLIQQADHAPQRQAGAVAAKLRRTVADLAERLALDPDRLHQEAVILAAKADVREELDRLATHLAAARAHLARDDAVGRRLDFLA